ncbi:tetratricopeptide repeat protein [Deinococcus lacus]|uniref:Tetratricopeptide repeat protein n=1 Tax=Deinococcus lacus TaxID=392561 RepID=A0ABW1Y9H6_9DEIO
MTYFTRIAALSAAVLLSAAGAQSLQSAQSLFDQGKWQEAAKAAAALNTSAGYALAAEATTMGAGISPAGSRKALYQQAQSYANKAIKLNANNAEAYFELARAQGRLAQTAGILESLGLAGDMKKNLQKAISLNPKLAGAYVALGLWNAELVAKGGAATLATGADAKQVAPNFQKAIQLEPNRIIHRLEYANALMLLSSKNKAAATEQLRKAVSLTPKTYWDRLDLQNAQKRLNSLK